MGEKLSQVFYFGQKNRYQSFDLRIAFHYVKGTRRAFWGRKGIHSDMNSETSIHWYNRVTDPCLILRSSSLTTELFNLRSAK